MIHIPADKTQAAQNPSPKTGGRHVAPCLLPTFSQNLPAPLLRLHLEHYQGPAGAPLTVTFFELDAYFAMDKKGIKARIQEGSKDVALATFQVIPVAAETPGGRASWSQPKPTTPGLETDPKHPIPYFRLTFAGKSSVKTGGVQEPDDYPVFSIPLDKAGEEEDGFEIAYEITDASGAVLARADCNVVKLHLPRCHVPPAHDGALLCGEIAFGMGLEAWMNRQYAAGAVDAAATPSLIQVETERQERMRKAAKQAMQELDQHLTTSESPYAAHARNYRDYHQALADYLRLLDSLSKSEEQDRETLGRMIEEKRQALDKRKADLDTYLSRTGAIPLSYQKQAEDLRKARERSRSLKEFLDHPITRVITLLPGMSVVGAVTKVAEGKYKEAFLDLGLDLLSAGSFNKLTRMAALFHALPAGNTASLAALLGFRYLQASLIKVGKLDTLLKLASRADPGYEALFTTFKGLKALKGHGDTVVNLLKSRKSLAGAAQLVVRNEIKTAEELIAYLKQAKLYDDFLLSVEFFKAFRTAENVKASGAKILNNLGQEEKQLEDPLLFPLLELRQLARHESILPSAKAADEGAEAVDRFIEALLKPRIPLSNVWKLIPQSDLEARINREKLTATDSQMDRFNVRMESTRAELSELLEKIKHGFQVIVPEREAEDRRLGLERFPYWDRKKCQWEYELETLVDKLADQLEARALLMGMEFELRPWLRGVSCLDPLNKNKWWIIHRGHADIGLDLCERMIEWVSR